MLDYSQIDSLRVRHWDDLGVHWDLSRIAAKHWYFSNFRRYRSSPKGNGAIALTELLAMTDQAGVSVELFAQDCEGNGTLVRYYERFGFQCTGKFYCGRYPIMIRKPQTERR